MPFWNYFFGGGTDTREPAQQVAVGGLAAGTITQGIAGPGLTLQNHTQGIQIQTGAAMQMQQNAAAQAGAGQQQYQTEYIGRNAYYGTIINYANDIHYPTPRPQNRQRGLSITQALEDLGYAFAQDGLTFSEITVPKDTFRSLYARFGVEVRMFQTYDPLAPPTIPKTPSSFIFNTAMGRIKIICDENQKTFDLENYLEVV